MNGMNSKCTKNLRKEKTEHLVRKAACGGNRAQAGSLEGFETKAKRSAGQEVKVLLSREGNADRTLTHQGAVKGPVVKGKGMWKGTEKLRAKCAVERLT